MAGKQIAEAAASRLIGATMQLGGKNPMLVLADADLDRAVPAAARAAFVSGGQMCLCAERIYVHESRYREFLDRLVAHTRTLRLGAGLDFDYDIGSLSSRRQLEKVVRHVDDAVAKGAAAEFGGRARPDLGPCFYEPTILTGVSADAEIFTAETFGPVVSVYPFHDEDEAVTAANATEYGLNASIWTRDLRARPRARRADHVRRGEHQRGLRVHAHLLRRPDGRARRPPATAGGTASRACCRCATCRSSPASTGSATTRSPASPTSSRPAR